MVNYKYLSYAYDGQVIQRSGGFQIFVIMMIVVLLDEIIYENETIHFDHFSVLFATRHFGLEKGVKFPDNSFVLFP